MPRTLPAYQNIPTRTVWHKAVNEKRRFQIHTLHRDENLKQNYLKIPLACGFKSQLGYISYSTSPHLIYFEREEGGHSTYLAYRVQKRGSEAVPFAFTGNVTDF